jgi:hypothetical protein
VVGAARFMAMIFVTYVKGLIAWFDARPWKRAKVPFAAAAARHSHKSGEIVI